MVRWSDGRAARLGSAKAPTAVRIRFRPLFQILQTKKFVGFFFARNSAFLLDFIVFLLVKKDVYTYTCEQITKIDQSSGLCNTILIFSILKYKSILCELGKELKIEHGKK